MPDSDAVQCERTSTELNMKPCLGPRFLPDKEAIVCSAAQIAGAGASCKYTARAGWSCEAAVARHAPISKAGRRRRRRRWRREIKGCRRRRTAAAVASAAADD